jgi:hypothetical protein
MLMQLIMEARVFYNSFAIPALTHKKLFLPIGKSENDASIIQQETDEKSNTQIKAPFFQEQLIITLLL